MKHLAMALIDVGMFLMCSHLYGIGQPVWAAIFAAFGLLYALVVAGTGSGTAIPQPAVTHGGPAPDNRNPR